MFVNDLQYFIEFLNFLFTDNQRKHAKYLILSPVIPVKNLPSFSCMYSFSIDASQLTYYTKPEVQRLFLSPFFTIVTILILIHLIPKTYEDKSRLHIIPCSTILITYYLLSLNKQLIIFYTSSITCPKRCLIHFWGNLLSRMSVCFPNSTWFSILLRKAYVLLFFLFLFLFSVVLLQSLWTFYFSAKLSFISCGRHPCQPNSSSMSFPLSLLHSPLPGSDEEFS